ncbi:MAG: response regulator transcription factor [Eggerthella sp.]|nr:response regulator transcription factor [Eggerthella sp.]
MALNASGVTGSYSIGLQLQGSLIAAGFAALDIPGVFEAVVSIETLLCAIAVVLAVRNLRETSEREAYRFAYDDLREGYLSLIQAAVQSAEKDNETAQLLAHETERFADLTERELSIVRLVAQGMDNREIASTLFLSEGTVRNHISSILSKKALSNRTQIAVLYYRN